MGRFAKPVLLCMLFIPLAGPVNAAPVGYAAQLETSRHNPVTHVLLLEADAGGTVHATVYGEDLPGNGYAVVRHDPPYDPVRSLVIGLTEGEDAEGNDKTQLVMFVADDFAAANQGVPYSDAFPGARHSLTIDSLLAAIDGDATQQAWFTDTFFTGPAAAAVFDTGGSFAVAEFTALDTIGGAITNGDWVLNQPFQSLPGGHANALNGLPTGVLDETSTGAGPFDIEVTVDDNGIFAMDKSVDNGTGVTILGFTLEVGTGVGANFVPTGNTTNLRFENEVLTQETSGAFPTLSFSDAQLDFDGSLAPGGTANFEFYVYTGTNGGHTVTVRQRAILDSSESRATFEVTKEFTDDNPSGVEVTISCNTGLPLEQTRVVTESAGVEFVVVEYDDGELDCEITEAVPEGYSAVYFDGLSNSSTACEYTDVAATDAFSCRITNTPDPVDVVITKEWVFEGSSEPDGIDPRYELVLWCDAEIVDGQPVGISGLEAPAGNGPGCGAVFETLEAPESVVYPNWCKAYWGEGAETFTAEVIPEYPDTHCYVVETVYDDAVEVENRCGDLVVSAGQGASCTVTNTVFFEGIPSLDRHGLALLALLTLGIGFVALRRYA